MCGIFGFLLDPVKHSRESRVLEESLRDLFLLSETRGREAAGLALRLDEDLYTLKQATSASEFIEGKRFKELLADVGSARQTLAKSSGQIAVIGHSRLVTNGFQSKNENNQPVIIDGAVAVHNGIITNEGQLWKKFPELERHFEVDTEIFLKLLKKSFSATQSLESAARLAFSEVEGSVSTASLLEGSEDLLLATNTGSLFFAKSDGFFVFASERFILNRFFAEKASKLGLQAREIEQLPAGQALLVSCRDGSLHAFDLKGEDQAAKPRQSVATKSFQWFDRSANYQRIQRCTKCILPSTYPMIRFDSEGVCNYCLKHKSIQVKGREALERQLAPYRSKNSSPDCIVAFSGGRDSCYGLHYVKKELGMNPVAFTFDWGLVTDLARRNQARVCAKLGVEHIIRAADIPTKRRYVRKNVEAWLQKPELGMVTLFTAGDKEFYHYARELRRETGLELIIFCTGNMIEDTPYKTGFCGFLEEDHAMTLTRLAKLDKFRLLWYYFKQYARNPGYWNESLWDTWMAYWHTFVRKEDFLWLYHYLPWDEKTIVSTLIEEYNWEVAEDTKTTWRIGDGTAAFYNYIYTSMAGFSEDDVMISNMIREGMLTREEGMARGEEYRKPRYPSLREYGQLIGINIDEALVKIDSAPKLF
jgi:glucosamine--fructose-6-phosphate aminotransferase (isomerizing)